jgi:SAM-dependent methyltransferase
MRTLSRADARRVYDRIGRTQDSQAFYEDRATAILISHLDLSNAHAVFEFGCGTGRFAAQLLNNYLPKDATYRAVDVSPVMVGLARERLAPFGPRVDVRLTEGEPPASEPTGAYDRFLSNFVFDLLSFEDIAAVLAEAHRMLRPNALLGLSSLTIGFTAASRALGWFLTMVHSLQPVIVGGCRPLELSELLAQDRWQVVHHERVAPLGLALEAVIAAPKENAAV